MRIVQIAPAIITGLSVVAAVVCFVKGEIKEGWYWIGAAVIGVSRTV